MGSLLEGISVMHSGMLLSGRMVGFMMSLVGLFMMLYSMMGRNSMLCASVFGSLLYGGMVGQDSVVLRADLFGTLLCGSMMVSTVVR